MTLLPLPALGALPDLLHHQAFQVTTQSTSGTPTTTFPLVPPEPASSAVGGVVFFLVVLIIAAGALVLYLRNRSPRATPGAGRPPGAS